MRIEKIAYEQLYPTGVYANQRYRAEASVEDGDDMMDCFFKLKKTVEDAFTELNPQIEWSQPMFHPPTQDETKPRNTQDQIIQDIKSCKEVKVLESYKLIAKSNPKIQEAYDEMMVLLIKKFEQS